jgi:hypothetical protein
MTRGPYPGETFQPGAPGGERRFPPHAATVAATAAFFALALLLQWLAGAYRAELSGHPDEPAHYVTGLMVHDYLKTWPPAPPVKFAGDFYLHYPKTALGHWPPFFYLLQAAWTLLFSISRTSVLVLMALLAALLAASLYRLVAAEYGKPAGLACGALLLLLPTVQEFAAMVMTEIPVALLCLWATLRFARFMQSGRWQDSVWFAIWASLAIMTKGSGLALALLPPLAMLLGRRLDLVRTKANWLAAAVVAAGCGPWYAFTFDMQQNGWVESAGQEFFVRSFPFNADATLHLVGPAVLACALLGLAVKVVLPWFRRRVEPKWAALAALAAGVFVFQSLVPASLDIRHLVTLAPPLVAFAAAGIAWLAGRLRWVRLPVRARAAALSAAVALLFAFQTFAIPPKIDRRLADLAIDVLARPEFAHAVILVSSQWDGEGIFISEMAMRERRPGHIILRASKMLSDARWSGLDYRLRFPDAAAVMRYLERVPVAVLIMDGTRGRIDKLHHHQLEQVLRDYAPRWQPVGRYPKDGRPRVPGQDVRVYRLLGADTAPAAPDLQLPPGFNHLADR